MRKTLNNEELEAQFQKDGYVKVPFLTEQEVEELKAYYFDTLPDQGGKIGPEDESVSSSMEVTYDFTFIDKNIDYKKQVFKKITEAFADRVKDYLADYKPIIANFIRKTENDGEVPLHQNWAFVDEMKCASVSIWCPLVDSNQTNGTLEVVPGSHKRYGKVRGPMIRSELLDINQDIIKECMVPMETKAGNAVILDDSLVHYSSPNQTDGLRLAIQLILIPSDFPSIHYHMDPAKNPEEVHVLEVDHEFYMQFNPWKKPEGNVKEVEVFNYKPFSMSMNEFKQGLELPRFDEKEEKKQSWWNKLVGVK